MVEFQYAPLSIHCSHANVRQNEKEGEWAAAAKRNEVRNLIEDQIAEKILHVEKEDVQAGQLVSHPEVCKLNMVEWSRHNTTQRSYEPHSPLRVTKRVKQLDVVHVGLEGRRASKVIFEERIAKGGAPVSN